MKVIEDKAAETIIEELLVSKEVKAQLRTIKKLACSDLPEIKKSVPSLFLAAEEGVGITSISKAYSQIIDESGIYSIRGSSTYLELVFPPANAPDKDRERFFASPKIAASITNRFYGTFVISFAKWKGQDLMKDESFHRFLAFIDENKENISFCFHVNGSFTAKEDLRAKISELVNLMDINLEVPDMEKACEYVVSTLEKAGYEFGESAIKLLQEQVLSRIVAGKNFAGYRTMDQVIRRIYYEIALSGAEEEKIIDKGIVVSLAKRWEEELERENSGWSPVGFSMRR